MFGLNNYRKRRMLEIDKEVQKYRDSFKSEVESLALACVKDMGSYEHEFHSTKEKLGIEIAKLEALRETLANDVTTYKKLLEEKDKEIDRVNKLCLELAKSNKVVYVEQK